MSILESLILTKLGEHGFIRSEVAHQDASGEWTVQICGCGYSVEKQAFPWFPDWCAHLASVITEAIGLEERLSNLWDDKFGGFVPLYRARGLESDPSEGE